MTEDKKNKKMCVDDIEALEDKLSKSISDGDKARTRYNQETAAAAAAEQNKEDAKDQKEKTQDEKTKFIQDYNTAKTARNDARTLDAGVLQQYKDVLTLVTKLQSELDTSSKNFVKEQKDKDQTSYGNSGQATQQGSSTAQYTGNKGLALIKDLVDNLIQETQNDINAGNKADKKLKTQMIQVTSKQQNEIDEQQQIESDEQSGEDKATTEAGNQQTIVEQEFGLNNDATNFYFKECSTGENANGEACNESHRLIALKAHCKTQIDGLPERIIKRQHEMDGLNKAINILEGMTA
jgi:hypothetical protein